MNFFAKFLSFLPRRVALSIGICLGTLAYYMFKRRRKLALYNFNHALGNQFSLPDQKKIIKKVFIHLSVNFIEFFRFQEITANNLSQFVTFHGKEHLQKAYDENNGVLVLTAHMGNWELLAAATSLAGFKSGMIVKAAHQQFFDNFLTQQRQAKDLHLLSGKNSIKEILGSLKAGRVVGIVIDQHGIGRDSIVVPFFNRPASTLKGLAVLSDRTHVPVIPMYIYRDKNFHHHIVIEPPVHHQSSDPESRTLQYTQWLESVIREHPEQWMWTHNRWKSPH